MTIEVFFSYAHEDEALRDELAKHLKLLERQGAIAAWYDREITAGTEWAGEIDAHLKTAGVILLLISADFLASDYCWDVELQQALARHEAGEARVIPVILREVDWSGAPFSELEPLPQKGKPVTSWANRDAAFKDIAQGIRRVVAAITGTPMPSEASSPPEPPQPSGNSFVISGSTVGNLVGTGNIIYHEAPKGGSDADS